MIRKIGSGKSYSMVGYGADRGIIPCACEELFRRIESNEDQNVKYKVESSMLEIYNEKVRDLFNPRNPKNEGGLKLRSITSANDSRQTPGHPFCFLLLAVLDRQPLTNYTARPGREHPVTGPYIDGLALIPVRDYSHINHIMDEGTSARTGSCLSDHRGGRHRLTTQACQLARASKPRASARARTYVYVCFCALLRQRTS